MIFYHKSLYRPRPGMAKILLVMRLIIVLLTTAILQVSASSYGQNVTLKRSGASLINVFTEIRKQTGYDFFYSDKMMANAKPISVTLKQASLEEALKQIFANQALQYELKDKTVVITEKEPSLLDRVRDITLNLFQGQAIDVRGRVVDAEGNPLVGASVNIKGGKGTTTDKDGRFYLAKVDDKTVLVISFIGYLTQEVNASTDLSNITLKVGYSKLDEVQVIAYGTSSQRLSTGNIGAISAEEIGRQPVNNPLLAMQGKVPGLQITQINGIAGGGVKVQIQGQNSLRYGSDPFYVIDGVPYASQMIPNFGEILGNSKSPGEYAEGGNGNPLSFINPQDIESISVLKDADATAIYGSRASNGAILITTKKGKAGDTRIDLNLQSGFGQVGRKLDLLNTEQYLEMRNEAMKNDGLIPSDDPGAQYPEVYAPDIKFWDNNRYTDWQKEIIGKTAKYNDGQLTISGGNGLTNYLIGGNFHKESSVFLGSLADQKGSVHFSINSASANNRFKVSLTGSYLSDDNHLIQTDMTQYAMFMPPNTPSLYNADGSLNWEPNALGVSTISPFSQPATLLLNKYRNKTNNLTTSLNLSYEIVNGLQISTNIGYTNMTSDENLYAVVPSASAPELQSFFTRTTRSGTNNLKSWIIEPQLNYGINLGPGELSVLLGTTAQQRGSSRQAFEAKGFNSDFVMDNLSAATNVVSQNTVAKIYKYNAGFGRLNYNIKDRYIINLTGRRDGSSRFGSANQFHNFGAVGAAYMFFNEKWIKNKLNFLSFGKVKGSFGTTGSDQVGDYEFLSLYRNEITEIPYRGISGLTPDKISNPYLQWEETKKLSVSLDLGFFKDRLMLNTTFFRNRSSNQLTTYVFPFTTGVGSIEINLPATIQNNGWEIALSSTNISNKDFSWSTNFNVTVPSNKLIKYDGLSTSSLRNDYVVGQPFTMTRLYKYSGLNQSTGTYEFIDKDGEITNAPLNEPLNRSVLVNTSQHFYGGLSNSVNYRRLQLDFFLQFVKQNGLNYRFGNSPGTAFINQPFSVLDRWQISGDNKPIQRFSSDYSIDNAAIGAGHSDAAWGDASFMRLKNVSLSWQIPSSLENKLKLKKLRIFAQAQNLLTITNYNGLDPETMSYSTLPPLRVVTFGINASL